MHQQDKEALLADWLENNLSSEQRAQFETLCSQDADFAAQVELANLAMFGAEQHQASSVPHWDRESSFSGPEKAPWWQSAWLPVSSMATSLVAILMVTSGFQMQSSDGTLTISFAKPQTAGQVEALVEQKLDDYQQTQQVAMNQFAESIRQQQLDASAQLTTYLLSSSRQERREDFAEFIKFINQQRNDDQQFYARQLNKLQDELYNEVTEPDWAGTRLNDPIDK